MRNVSKFFLFSVGVGLAAIFCSLLVYSYNVGQFRLGSFFTQFSKALTSANEPKFSKYSGRYVDGEAVRSTIEAFGGDYFFRIRTKKDALTFAVYERPLDHLLYDGSGKYYDYTDSGSLYYIDEKSLYLTTVFRNDGGTVIGAMFEEKDSGSISAAVSDLYHLTDLLESKKKYLEEVSALGDSFSTESINASIQSAEGAVQVLRDQIAALTEDTGGSDVDTALQGQYEEKKAAMESASQALAKAWEDYEAAFVESTGKESLGHYEISTNNGSGDPDDLQYWINKFSGSGGDGGS